MSKLLGESASDLIAITTAREMKKKKTTLANQHMLIASLDYRLRKNISWWIYDRQKRTTDKQDATLERIKDVDERHDKILKRLEQYERHSNTILDTILKLDKKIEHIIEMQDRIHKSIQSHPFNGNNNIIIITMGDRVEQNTGSYTYTGEAFGICSTVIEG